MSRALRRSLSSGAPSARPGRALGFALSLAATLLAGAAFAQHDGEVGNAPLPPAGDGALTVEVVHPTTPSETAGIALALYSLTPDGLPGFTGAVTGPDGRFTFEGISSDPQIMYLVGARYQEIPFGERVTFAPGEKQARLQIQISAPTDQVEGVSVDELRLRLDWMGDRVVVHEIQRLSNTSGRVIQLPAEDTERAITLRPLPEGARDFSQAAASMGSGLEIVEGAVRFSGPLYPGEQRVEYEYSLPLPSQPSEGGDGPARLAVAGEGTQTDALRALRIPVELREGAGRVVVVAGTQGIDVTGGGLLASSEVSSDAGQPLSAWAGGALRGGRPIELAIQLPESRFDRSLVSIPRGDVWLEMDDTQLTATVDLQIQVAPGAPVAGTPDAPLMRVSLPEGASLRGVAPEAEAFGLVPTDNGAFDVIGPIGPGTRSLGFSYTVPGNLSATGSQRVDLDLRFPLEISTLNVLIADTGLALDSQRLHRRRPFRNGTRNYLHREAFNVSPDEVVDLSLEPLSATGLPASASLALTFAGVVGAALFLMAPLRSAARREHAVDPRLATIQAERDSIYAAIDDLDHDFETGKLEAEDYTQMREGLRADAIEWLRAERAATQGIPAATVPPSEAPVEQATAPAGPATRGATVAQLADPRTGAFCPSCGQAVKPAWRFCSHCGEGLDPAVEQAREQARE